MGYLNQVDTLTLLAVSLMLGCITFIKLIKTDIYTEDERLKDLVVSNEWVSVGLGTLSGIFIFLMFKMSTFITMGLVTSGYVFMSAIYAIVLAAIPNLTAKIYYASSLIFSAVALVYALVLADMVFTLIVLAGAIASAAALKSIK